MGFASIVTTLISDFQSFADTHGWIVRYDNDQRATPTSGLWFQFTINFIESENKEIGSVNSYRNRLEFIIKVRNDAGLGMSGVLYPVDLIATAYRRKIIGDIITRVSNIKKIGRVDDLYQVNVICPFYLDN